MEFHKFGQKKETFQLQKKWKNQGISKEHWTPYISCLEATKYLLQTSLSKTILTQNLTRNVSTKHTKGGPMPGVQPVWDLGSDQAEYVRLSRKSLSSGLWKSWTAKTLHEDTTHNQAQKALILSTHENEIKKFSPKQLKQLLFRS